MNVSEQDELLLNAYVDGELDPMEAVRFEQRLGAEPALSAQVEARRALRNALGSDLGEDVPSPDLRRRVMAKLSRRGPGEWLSWRMAASFLIGAVLAGTMSVGLLNDRPGENVAHAVVSAHIRALMAPQPTDVASPDQAPVMSPGPNTLRPRRAAAANRDSPCCFRTIVTSSLSFVGYAHKENAYSPVRPELGRPFPV